MVNEVFTFICAVIEGNRSLLLHKTVFGLGLVYALVRGFVVLIPEASTLFKVFPTHSLIRPYNDRTEFRQGVA